MGLPRPMRSSTTEGRLVSSRARFTSKDALKDPVVQVGVVCIRGSNSGGKAALKLAAQLTAEKIPVRFVGIQDGALFNRDASNSPIPAKIPLPRVMFFAANSPTIKSLFAIDPNATKHNFWQDKQNRGQVGASGRFWTSDLNGEVHGKLVAMGFQDNEVKPAGNSPHGEAVTQGEISNVANISALLNAL